MKPLQIAAIAMLFALTLAIHAQSPVVAVEQLVPAGGVYAQPTDQGDSESPNATPLEISFDAETQQQLFDILIVILVLSVVFELALTPIFKWSIFIKYLKDYGARTPIAVGLALVTFWAFDLDIFRDLMNAMTVGEDVPTTFWGKLLTALLIAGGSATVYEIFNRLNIQKYQVRVDEVRSRGPGSQSAPATGQPQGGPPAVVQPAPMTGQP